MYIDDDRRCKEGDADYCNQLSKGVIIRFFIIKRFFNIKEILIVFRVDWFLRLDRSYLTTRIKESNKIVINRKKSDFVGTAIKKSL